MARYTGPKNRIARREGVDLGMKTVGSHAHAALLRRLNINPGQHGVKGRRKISDYGRQLREKQKAKRMYGMLEKQFRTLFERARKFRGNTGDQLISFCERRLDNTVYRGGLAPTRAAARQLVSHGHIRVNEKKIDIPSYEIKEHEVITISEKGMAVPAIKKLLDEKNPQIPEWLERKGPALHIARLPQRSDVSEDIMEQYIIEYYSR